MEGTRKVVKVFIGSEALALVITLVSQALSLYGVISISLARLFLGLAWIVAVLGVLVSDYLYEKSWEHIAAVTIVCGLVLASVFIGLDTYAVGKKASQEVVGQPSTQVRTQPQPQPQQLSPQPSIKQEGPKTEPRNPAKKTSSPPSLNTSGNKSPIIQQSNSGGTNVQQATTGDNSPIIDSPITVNPPPPQPQIKWTQAAGKPTKDGFATVTVTLSVDHTVEIPAFAATCDRPCATVDARPESGGSEPHYYFSDEQPNVAGFGFEIPRPLGAGIEVNWIIKSADENPIHVTNVQFSTPPPHP
jgi:hypothetical protein